MSEPATSTDPQPNSIRQALADDAWEGHDETLTDADLEAIADTVGHAAAAIAMSHYDTYPTIMADDTARVAGWNSATKHIAHALTYKAEPITEALLDDAWEDHEDALTGDDLDDIASVTSGAAAAIASSQLDAFLDSPNLDTNWIAGWHAAVEHIAAILDQ